MGRLVTNFEISNLRKIYVGQLSQSRKSERILDALSILFYSEIHNLLFKTKF